MSNSNCGLKVTAKQTYYPIELSNAELLTHYETIQEYHNDISENVLRTAAKFKPDTKMIDMQPQMNPNETRSTMVNFLFELSVLTRVTNGIFFHSVRLYDRYCSKRVILRDQANLVAGTCLWLAAKTWGGCSHVINNVTVPTGGRFYGPNPRARVPRLSELVHYCGGSEVFDESMFMQMERHILDTLNWDVYEMSINDYVLNVDENCLIQYELYEAQLKYSREMKMKHNSGASKSTIDMTEDDEEYNELRMKIELINLKKFLIDLSCWNYKFLKAEMHELCQSIFDTINRFTSQDQGPLLSIPSLNPETSEELINVFVETIVNLPDSIFRVYKDQTGVFEFIVKVREYNDEMQRKYQAPSIMDLSKRLAINTQYVDIESGVPSPAYSTDTLTPMRHSSAQSDNSVFSVNHLGNSSPLTPHMHSFTNFKNDSAHCSSTSLSSIPNDNRANAGMNNYSIASTNKPTHMDYDNKENQLPV